LVVLSSKVGRKREKMKKTKKKESGDSSESGICSCGSLPAAVSLLLL
jgi:hypothetical protein